MDHLKLFQTFVQQVTKIGFFKAKPHEIQKIQSIASDILNKVSGIVTCLVGKVF